MKVNDANKPSGKMKGYGCKIDDANKPSGSFKVSGGGKVDDTGTAGNPAKPQR
jgi:hypothetical protein